jgi:tripartite-type tricarboxylate transporter receptor subunit TctC
MANLSMELVNQLAGTQFQHVAYKGGAATITDLLGGQLPIGMLDLGSVLPQVNAGKLRVLAISSNARASVLPEVPTIAETLGTFEAAEWFGLVAPRGVPRDIITKYEQEIRRALRSPAAKAKYGDPLGWELVASTPEEMGAVLESQTRKWGELVRTLGLKLD